MDNSSFRDSGALFYLLQAPGIHGLHTWPCENTCNKRSPRAASALGQETPSLWPPHGSRRNIILFPSFTSFTVFYLNQSNVEFNETESYSTQAPGKYSQDQEENKNDNAIFPPIHSSVPSSS